jgi:hypothetical protein
MGPVEVGPILECVSDRELAGEPLPPPIELIPWSPPLPEQEPDKAKAGDGPPVTPPA